MVSPVGISARSPGAQRRVPDRRDQIHACRAGGGIGWQRQALGVGQTADKRGESTSVYFAARVHSSASLSDEIEAETLALAYRNRARIVVAPASSTGLAVGIGPRPCPASSSVRPLARHNGSRAISQYS